MITAVDTSVLLDVFAGNQEFSPASAAMVRKCISEGALVVCELVWAETAAVFDGHDKLSAAMKTLGVSFLPCNEAAAAKAGEIWKQYRHSGGKRNRVIADFLIGAHAQLQCDRLLTRDRGFYRTYFDTLRVEDPSAGA